MKSLLFIINSLTIGGSEKSLISLLNSMDYSKYNVDLLMLKRDESFDKYIPSEVNILDVPEYYSYLLKNYSGISLLKRVKYRVLRTKCSLEIRNNGKSGRVRNNQQIFYSNQKRVLKNINKLYDVGIAYAQGFPTYFLAEKVTAKKKFAWINCDYAATMYDKKEDKYFYDKIDKIIAVSQACKESIIRVDKDYEGKVEIIKDIVNPKLINEMANEYIEEMNNKGFNIVTVARLVLGYKGYDIAVKACKLLKEKGFNFKWYVVGDGPDKERIQARINHEGVNDRFILLGSKDNPYPYMKNCNLYVQPSRKEGFGLTVVEAKILNKPIVCTNFTTAHEIINDGIDGVVVDVNPVALFIGIAKLMKNNTELTKITDNLQKCNCYNSTGEIKKIYNLFEGEI